MIAPLMPENYTCNVIQRKWNINGANINHTYSGIWYSSYQVQRIRFDGLVADFNHTDTIQYQGLQLSILDFSVKPSVNYYFGKISLSDQGSCGKLSPVTGFFAPPPPTFLRDIGAIFAGNDYDSNYGVCQKWSFFLSQVNEEDRWKFPFEGDTLITFWFDYALSFVRWDLLGIDLQTGVQTWQYNVMTGIKFDNTTFATLCET
jgi:hypothetical protein